MIHGAKVSLYQHFMFSYTTIIIYDVMEYNDNGRGLVDILHITFYKHIYKWSVCEGFFFLYDFFMHNIYICATGIWFYVATKTHHFIITRNTYTKTCYIICATTRKVKHILYCITFFFRSRYAIAILIVVDVYSYVM